MNSPEVKICDCFVGERHEPFITAELSGNHNQSIDRAIELIESAAQCGVDAIKLQTYTADTITLKSSKESFTVRGSNGDWEGRTLYDLYDTAHTPWEWHKRLFDYAKSLGLIIFSSPFDHSAVDFLMDLEVPCFKIASFENTDVELIKKVASTKKPVILSTGMASLGEIERSVNLIHKYGCGEIILLKCTSTYPANPLNSNLRTISHLKQSFGCPVGVSDHTMGIGVSVGAVALGASFVEKHFTLDRSDGGVDSSFSMEPHEMALLVNESKICWQSMGQVKYGVSEEEKSSLKFRRSIYITQDLKTGDKISRENIKSVRPGFGLKIEMLPNVLGMRVTQDIPANTPLSWDHFK